MANESNKELTSVWTPANIVTCVRIVFIPVFMIVSALSHTSVAGTDWSTFDGPLAAAAFILYVILSCTDKVDGYLARSRNEITDSWTPSPISCWCSRPCCCSWILAR